uniref:Uncharacterized protein n=1 Tax=Arundo donax TaxID=35708 RepID=A0A0A9HWV3_ARUDO
MEISSVKCSLHLLPTLSPPKIMQSQS